MLPERDYRGVPVVGAWHWIDEHQFGVVTKIDATEAFQPLRVLRWIFRILILLILLAAVLGLVAVHLSSIWRRRFDEAQLSARQLGQYTLITKIGEGAMGSVYRARHALLRRETAVKLLLPDRADDDLIRQFEHEVQLTCRLTHPNTIQIFDYGYTADGIFYYAMELLEGLTLQDLIDHHGPQPEARVIHLLRQAAESLREAHGIGLIHRDIKPGNLILCERGGMPDTLKVLDFGLVREISTHSDVPEKTRENGKAASRFLGTPLYMAPETIRHPGHGDIASDIYALSAVAYVLVTGRALFSAPTVEEVWKHHLDTPVPSPRHNGAPDLSDSLEQLILDGLSKDPSHDRPTWECSWNDWPGVRWPETGHRIDVGPGGVNSIRTRSPGNREPHDAPKPRSASTSVFGQTPEPMPRHPSTVRVSLGSPQISLPMRLPARPLTRRGRRSGARLVSMQIPRESAQRTADCVPHSAPSSPRCGHPGTPRTHG